MTEPRCTCGGSYEYASDGVKMVLRCSICGRPPLEVRVRLQVAPLPGGSLTRLPGEGEQEWSARLGRARAQALEARKGAGDRDPLEGFRRVWA